MERQYSHLTWKNRLKIRRMLDERRKPKEIADALHVHTSTIYREIKRGQTWQMTSEWEYVQKYCPETAERKYRENLQAKGPDLKIRCIRIPKACWHVCRGLPAAEFQPAFTATFQVM